MDAAGRTRVWRGISAPLVAALVALPACSGGDADESAPSSPASREAAVSTSASTTPDASATPDTSATPGTADRTSEPAAGGSAPGGSASRIAAQPSPGCASATAPAGAPAEQIVPLSAAERTGRYLEALPQQYDGRAPIPLVLDLHGYQEPLEVHRVMTDFVGTGAEHGFAVVVPQIDRDIPRWEAVLGSKDIAFVEAVLDDVLARRCIDARRVYATGFSNGAFMTSVLACALGDRIAAVAAVAGVRDPECAFPRPVPAVVVHGTNDTYVAYEGGFGPSVASLPTPGGGTIGAQVVSDTGPSIEEITAVWAGRNGCRTTAPAKDAVAPDVVRLAFDCPAGAEVALYRVEGGGHSWPGSEFSRAVDQYVGDTTFSIDANEVIWSFFAAHALPD